MNKYKVKVVFIESGKCGYVIVEAIDHHLALQVAQREYECVAISSTMIG
jgi:hypothetical protein